MLLQIVGDIVQKGLGQFRYGGIPLAHQQIPRPVGRFHNPAADNAGHGLRGGLRLLAVGSGNGRGSGKRDGASQDGGRVLLHILPSPPWTLGVAENRPGVFLQSVPEIT